MTLWLWGKHSCLLSRCPGFNPWWGIFFQPQKLISFTYYFLFFIPLYFFTLINCYLFKLWLSRLKLYNHVLPISAKSYHFLNWVKSCKFFENKTFNYTKTQEATVTLTAVCKYIKEKKITNFPSGFEPRTQETWNFESNTLPTELLHLERFLIKNRASNCKKISAPTPKVFQY